MLEVRGLFKHFGGVRAVDGVSFEVQAGQCVALIGPNGAGKSTCFACIAGQYAQAKQGDKGIQAGQGGEVSWHGHVLDHLSPGQRLQRGVARTFQVAQVFEALSVLQNVQLAAAAAPTTDADALHFAGRRGARVGASALPRLSALRRLDAQHVDFAQALLNQTGLTQLADAEASSLPYGAKKRLELALALAARPQLLLLDEPAAGLAEAERASLMRLVKTLAAQGMAVLYTEHNMDAVAGVADRVLVLMEGKIVAEGSFEHVANDPVVRSRYLGQALGQAKRVTAVDTAQDTPGEISAAKQGPRGEPGLDHA